MQFLSFYPYRGYTHLFPDIFPRRANPSGYDRIEAIISPKDTEEAWLAEPISTFNLQLIAQQWKEIDAKSESHKHFFKNMSGYLASKALRKVLSSITLLTALTIKWWMSGEQVCSKEVSKLRITEMITSRKSTLTNGAISDQYFTFGR